MLDETVDKSIKRNTLLVEIKVKHNLFHLMKCLFHNTYRIIPCDMPSDLLEQMEITLLADILKRDPVGFWPGLLQLLVRIQIDLSKKKSVYFTCIS